MSDLSFNIVALDKASATFVRVASQMDKVADKLDKLDGKKAEVSVNVKTDESTKALDSFSTRFKLLAGAITAASPLAGAAIIGGIGAGFIGVAALAQKSNVEVQASWRNMSQGIALSTKQATDRLVPQFVGAGNMIAAEAQRLQPLLVQAFSTTGPVIVATTNAVVDFAHNAMPGVTSAMNQSLPVFVGVQNAAGTVGRAFGDAISSVGQHSQQYGTVVTSMGSITGSVVTNATSIVNTLGTAWADNASQINGAVGGVTADLSGLATGVLPILSATLNVAAGSVHVISDALGPLAPMLGFVAATAGATWVAFKLAGTVSVAVKALAMGVVTLGGTMEASAAKSATMIAGMRGVAVQSSATAVAVKAAGTSAATASIGFAATASAVAGPLSIALVGATILFGLFSSGQDDAKISSDDLKAANDTLASALQSTHGAFNQQAIDALKTTDAFKIAAESTGKFGISSDELMAAVLDGGPKLDALRDKLNGVSAAHTSNTVTVVAGRSAVRVAGEQMDETGRAAQTAAGNVDALSGTMKGTVQAQRDAAAAAKNVADNLFSITAAGATTSPAMETATATAQKLGIPLDEVQKGFREIIASGRGVATDMPGVAATFQTLKVAAQGAAFALGDHFSQMDKAVVSAKSSVTSAARSYQQSLGSIKDAQHSAAQASKAVTTAEQGVADAARGVTTAKRAQRDAIVGVGTAQQSFLRAQKAELDAQLAVNVARGQAIEDLKEMHLQLEDAVVSEETARVRLFEQRDAAKGFGITDANAKDIAKQDVSYGNIDKVKAAIDLVSAQNALNNAMSSGTKLRNDVAAADARGVDNATGVVSAQNALVSAHEQTISAADGVTKAQQQVEEANYGLTQASRGLTRAQEGVTEAAYAEGRAHAAVRDAQDQSGAAAARLKDAKADLTVAEGNASRSLDLNTEAGRRNRAMLDEFDAAITAQYGPTVEGYKTKVDTVAGAFNISRDAAIDFLKNQNAIPKDFKYDVTAVANVDTASLKQVFKSTAAGGYFSDSMNQKKAIGATGLKAGGHVRGPGGPRGDQIDAKLSDNEFVQPAHIVDYYGVGFMEDIRHKKVPKYADGGVVSMNALGAGTGAAYISTVNAQNMMGLPAPKQLPKWEPAPVIAINPYLGGAVPNLAGVRGSNRQIVMQIFADQFGWGSPPQVAATDRLLGGESGYNNLAQNPTSTAFGMFQFLNATWGGYGIPKTSDPALQTVAGGRYIKARYGDPISAFAAWASRSPHWYADGGLVSSSAKPKGYDQGGWINPGDRGVNGLTKPEAVLTPAQSDAYISQAKAAAAGKGGNTYVYNLKVYEAKNETVNLEAQFKRMEIMSGM